MSKSKHKDAREGFTYDDWCELYEYVKHNILSYDVSMKLPKFMVLRLQGLSKGQFIANNNARHEAEYPYNVILMTFKFCSMNIKRAFSTKKFKSEQNKFNYMMVIIENNINDIYMRLKKIETEKDKVENIEIDVGSSNRAEYKGRNDSSKVDISSMIEEDIW